MKPCICLMLTRIKSVQRWWFVNRRHTISWTQTHFYSLKTSLVPCVMILIFSPKMCYVSPFHMTMNQLVFCQCYYLELHSGVLSVTPWSSQNGADTDIVDRYNQNLCCRVCDNQLLWAGVWVLQGVGWMGKRVMSTNDIDRSPEQRLTTGTRYSWLPNKCPSTVRLSSHSCHFIHFTRNPCGFFWMGVFYVTWKCQQHSNKHYRCVMAMYIHQNCVYVCIDNIIWHLRLTEGCVKGKWERRRVNKMGEKEGGRCYQDQEERGNVAVH